MAASFLWTFNGSLTSPSPSPGQLTPVPVSHDSPELADPITTAVLLFIQVQKWQEEPETPGMELVGWPGCMTGEGGGHSIFMAGDWFGPSDVCHVVPEVVGALRKKEASAGPVAQAMGAPCS